MTASVLGESRIDRRLSSMTLGWAMVSDQTAKGRQSHSLALNSVKAYFSHEISYPASRVGAILHQAPVFLSTLTTSKVAVSASHPPYILAGCRHHERDVSSWALRFLSHKILSSCPTQTVLRQVRNAQPSYHSRLVALECTAFSVFFAAGKIEILCLLRCLQL